MRTLLSFGVLFFLSSAIASAGTVTAVRLSMPSAAAGATVTATVSGTNPCGAAFINWGDGTAITYAITGLPTTQNHAYARPGTYSVIARGMGNCDGEASAKLEITGDAPPPPPPAASAITAVSFSPTPGVVRQPVTIAIAGHGQCTLTVSFGDGNSQEVTTALPSKVTHVYAVAQTYTVIVAPAVPCAGKFTERLQIASRAGARITGLTLDPPIGAVGRSVAIVVEGVATCGYRVDYGDGNSEGRTKPLPDRLHHVYNATGSYIVAVAAVAPCEGGTQRTLDVR